MEPIYNDIILIKICNNEQSFVETLKKIEEFNDLLFEDDDNMEDYVCLLQKEIKDIQKSAPQPCFLLKNIPQERALEINTLINATGSETILRISTE